MARGGREEEEEEESSAAMGLGKVGRNGRRRRQGVLLGVEEGGGRVWSWRSFMVA